MSTLAAKALAISSLFVRNVYRQFWPDLNETRGVFFARCTIVVVLALGAISAWLMGDFLSIVNIVLTVNLPFGACVLLGYFWRRLTVQGVWSCVILSTLMILIIPWTAAKVPALANNQFLAQTSLTPSGRPAGVYFANVIHADAEDLSSPLVGSGRLNLECLIMDRVGLNSAALSPNMRLTAQFFFDGLFPFAVLIIASLLTRPTDPARVAQFYGKMKTPVGETPELEAAAMEETRRNPARFDDTKLFPRTNWEFCRWTKVDTVGFLICSALSGAIVLLFIGLLKWAAP
jgi:solute:Na+ symporter, SSS family